MRKQFFKLRYRYFTVYMQFCHRFCPKLFGFTKKHTNGDALRDSVREFLPVNFCYKLDENADYIASSVTLVPVLNEFGSKFPNLACKFSQLKGAKN
jgi:hypothetical protein